MNDPRRAGSHRLSGGRFARVAALAAASLVALTVQPAPLAHAGPTLPPIDWGPRAVDCEGGQPYVYALGKPAEGNFNPSVAGVLGVGTDMSAGDSGAGVDGLGPLSQYSFRKDVASSFMVRVPVPAGAAFWVSGIYREGKEFVYKRGDEGRYPSSSCSSDGSLVRGQAFTDVPQGMAFFDDMGWLADMKVSTGWLVVDGAEFRPLSSVNRDAMAAFMYRLAGEPEFASPTTSPFLDVTPQTQFYKEITWLAAEGISTGWDVAGGKEFRPVTPVNRDAMAAFMYRYAGAPEFEAPTASPFVDAPPQTQFYKEITWLAAKGISTGWDMAGGKEFRPVTAVNRDAMAAFMHRFAKGAARTLDHEGLLFVDAVPLTQFPTWTQKVGASAPLTESIIEGNSPSTVRMGADTPAGTTLTIVTTGQGCGVNAYILDDRGATLVDSPAWSLVTHEYIARRTLVVPEGGDALRLERINGCAFSVTR